MKVLLCEKNFNGHRKVYFEWLSKIGGIEFYCFAPENIGFDLEHFIVYSLNSLDSFKKYKKWINQIRAIVKRYSIDVVHILDGDSIMKFFGYGFSLFPTKIIITYHHFFNNFLRKISYRSMCKSKNCLAVVHTEFLLQSIQKIGIKNAIQCNYPAFYFDSIGSKDTLICKKKWNLPEKTPIIGIIGGMNTYKNILPFLEILQNCQMKFHLLICGKEIDVTLSEIEEKIKPYIDKVTLTIRRLSDEEYESAIVASDIIFCIYNLDFDGASGPLTDGVCAQKIILSCKHGSLGDIVKKNSLGFIADSMNPHDILFQTEQALKSVKQFSYGEKANQYRKTLSPKKFQETYKRIYEVVGEDL